jgi:hypothetical protein
VFRTQSCFQASKKLCLSMKFMEEACSWESNPGDPNDPKTKDQDDIRCYSVPYDVNLTCDILQRKDMFHPRVCARVYTIGDRCMYDSKERRCRPVAAETRDLTCSDLGLNHLVCTTNTNGFCVFRYEKSSCFSMNAEEIVNSNCQDFISFEACMIIVN